MPKRLTKEQFIKNIKCMSNYSFVTIPKIIKAKTPLNLKV